MTRNETKRNGENRKVENIDSKTDNCLQLLHDYIMSSMFNFQ